MSDIQLLPAVVEFLARPHGHFIDGQYLAAEAGPSIDIHDPSSGAVISRIAEASEAEVARAVVSARQAFKGSWAEVSPYQKGVVLNRLGHDGFPDTICAVVKQGVETKACQFSWWCDGRPDQVEEPQRYDVAKEIARKALNQQLKDPTGGALYFHDRTVRPDWAKAYRKTAQTTHFLFYKPNQALAH